MGDYCHINLMKSGCNRSWWEMIGNDRNRIFRFLEPRAAGSSPVAPTSVKQGLGCKNPGPFLVPNFCLPNTMSNTEASCSSCWATLAVTPLVPGMGGDERAVFLLRSKSLGSCPIDFPSRPWAKLDLAHRLHRQHLLVFPHGVHSNDLEEYAGRVKVKCRLL